jgi:hypothetical protein
MHSDPHTLTLWPQNARYLLPHAYATIRRVETERELDLHLFPN